MLERILGICRRRHTQDGARPLAQRLSLERLEDRTVPAAAFMETNLISDVAGVAQFTDPNLRDPWGLAINPQGSFSIANAATGTVTLYQGDVNGSAISRSAPVIDLPTDPNQNQIQPSGEIYNPTSDFDISVPGYSGPALFIVAGLDGTLTAIAPTYGGTTYTTAPAYQAELVATTQNAAYTGLAIGNNGESNLLYAANVTAGTIDVFNTSFQLVSTTGSFTDPNLPAGYTPFNVTAINGTLVVTYKSVSTPNAGGVIDEFDMNGNFLGRFATGGSLNAPWAVVQAPANFGSYGNDILVGNFGDGKINVFDPSGNYVGQVSDVNGQPIAIAGLWQLAFGNGTTAGNTAKLYFTSGLNGETDGLFGSIAPAAATSSSFVSQAYLDLLGRQPTTTESANWTSQLNSGASRLQVVQGIQSTVEYQTREVNNAYELLLHRNADAGGMAYWLAQLQNGATIEQIDAGIAGSAEFYTAQGGGTTGGFLSALYNDALGRAPDANGEAFYVSRMQAGATNEQVALAVFTSEEYRTDLVTGFYQTYLRRTPDSGGLAYWVAALNNGERDEGVIAAIVASAEYYGRLGSTASSITPTVTQQGLATQPALETNTTPPASTTTQAAATPQASDTVLGGLPDQVSVLPNQVSPLPNQVSPLPNQVSAMPNQVSASPDMFQVPAGGDVWF
jgi:uncharacterized protein (TIGR03118 family)